VKNINGRLFFFNGGIFFHLKQLIHMLLSQRMKQHIYLQQMGIAEAEDYLLSSPLQSLKADASTIAGVEDDCIIFYKSA